MMRIKLKHQLNLMFMVIGCFILTISSIAIYYQIMSTLKEKSERSTVSQFQHMERTLLSFRQEVERQSVDLLLNPLVREFLRNQDSAVDHLFAGLELAKLFKAAKLQNSWLESVLLFAGDGDVVSEAQSSPLYQQGRKDMPFYRSNMHQASTAQSFRIFWYGGRQLVDFVSPDVMTDDKHTPLISTVRYIEISQTLRRGGTLVLNISEQALASLYESLAALPDETAYIVDKEGTVISSLDKTGLGKRSEVVDKLDTERQFGSISYKPEQADARQVVYYELESSDWVLIKEIPIKLFNGDLQKLQRILVIALISSLALMMLFSNYWTQLILKPLRQLTDQMQKLQHGQLGVQVEGLPHNEIGLLSRQFNRMSQSIVDLIQRSEAIEAKKHNHEIKALQAQITPHFLYNTLNVIKWMAVARKADDIADSVVALGNMLMPFYKYTSPLWSLEDEIAYIHNYVKLMNRRYGEGIHLSCRVPNHLLQAQVLKFMLQPIVENALQHGFELKQFQGRIEIDVSEEEGRLLVAVEDDGIGMDEEQLKRTELHMKREYAEEDRQESIGLNNTHSRLKLHFGSEYGIQLSSRQGKGTIVLLCLPMLKEES
ncbi:sensor histidine kinase [Paenibacillus eucommiae]|uniref:histidine kinase n=1 Tax=Paenibacillus eucommiae TaxID=1355755 RepID=A0ABS4IMS0_9BACL|nr:sensor histidine kinase [Paenibacillus eucommiae]MBP1988834.1 sensor histidine kinase YesM [Paenibacillus eucommiae]